MNGGIFLLLLVFQFTMLLLPAQKDDGLHYIINAGVTTETFKERTYYKHQKIPFREILVIDKRFDTTKIGYTNANSFKIQLGPAWSDILNNYFKDNLDKSSGRVLVIAIKSFWMQRGVLDKALDKKIVLKSVTGRAEGDKVKLDNGGSCTVSLDIYSKSDTAFQALFQIETSFINASKNYRKNTLDEFFFLPFDSIAAKMAITDLSNLLQKKRKLSWKELDDYYDKRFNLPLLNEPVIRKGIFMTFDDFKKNKPVETDFRLKEGKITDELYMGKGQTENLVTDYWGFFDGNFLYIKAGFSAFKAIRRQNTFEIYGARQVSNYHNDAQPGDIKLNSVGIDRKILQVNMDNGELY
jgi:hypothetical protein